MTDCVNCHDGDEMPVCTFVRDMRSYHDWNEELRTAIYTATLFEESETLDNLTEPTDISLVTSLLILVMLASEKVPKDITAASLRGGCRKLSRAAEGEGSHDHELAKNAG